MFDKTRASVLAERPRNVKRSLVADVAFILHFLGRRMLHIFRKMIKRNSCTISLQSFVLVQLSKKENIFPGCFLLEGNVFLVNFDGTVESLSSVAS